VLAVSLSTLLAGILIKRYGRSGFTRDKRIHRG
jgi:hypothetical protein